MELVILFFQVPKGKQAGILYSTLCIVWGILSGSHRTMGSAKAILETVDGQRQESTGFCQKVKSA